MKLIFDAETDGFVSEATKIHCIVIKNIDTNKFYSYKYDEIEKGLKLLSDADLLVGHNISKFDLLVIKKLYPDFKYKAKIFDTLLCSRLIWTNRKEEDFRLKEVPNRNKIIKDLNLPAVLFSFSFLDKFLSLSKKE